MGKAKNKNKEEVEAREAAKEQLGHDIIVMATSRRSADVRRNINVHQDDSFVDDCTAENNESVIEIVDDPMVAGSTIDDGIIEQSPARSNVNSNNLSQSRSDTGRGEEPTDIRSAVADRRKRRRQSRESNQCTTGGGDLRSFGEMIKEADLVRADVEREKLKFERERYLLEKDEREKDRSLQREEQERRYNLESERHKNEQRMRDREIQAREKSDIEKMKLLLNFVKDQIKK